ncbi:MAG: hypothetical protein AAGH88_15040 [Planctomycetota bacterium]
MLLVRKIGKTLRGGAKPYQVFTATILGAMIGFAPPFQHGPLWIIALVLLLAVVNANLFIATFTAGFAKLLSYLLIPVSFELGVLLVDGPLQGVYTALINGPVTALLGLDYYVTSGGGVLAIVIGIAWGMVVVRGLRIFRTKMAKIEAESEKYADWATKRWVRLLCWVMFGGKAKQSYADLLEQKKIGNPVRIPGVIFAVLVVALMFVVQQFFSSSIVTWYVKAGLERFNGATVDLEGVELDLADGRLTVDRLAMADPRDLGKDIFRANELTADLSGTDLLRKRMTINLVLIDDATSGLPRERPGVLVGRPPEPPEDSGEGKSLEEWFEQAQVWKARLETLNDWFDKLKGPPEPEDDGGIRGRARERAERYGYANVRATHLIEDSPTLLVKEIKINPLQGTWPKDETLDITMTNLSTQPWLAEDKPAISVVSSGLPLEGGGVGEPTFRGGISLAPRAWPKEVSTIQFELNNQNVAGTLDQLSIDPNASLKADTWSAKVGGDWEAELIDLDMDLVIDKPSFTFPFEGAPEIKLDELPLRLDLTGSFSSPRLALDREQLTQTISELSPQFRNALLEFGTDQFRGLAAEHLDSEELRGALDQLPPELRDRLMGDGEGPLGGLGRELFGPGDDENDDEGEDEDRGPGRGLLDLIR